MDMGIVYRPTDAERKIVETLAAFGHSIKAISAYLDMDANTLQKHFERELKTGKIELSRKCGGRLYECVQDETAKDSDRNDAAKYLLSRLCGWTEKMPETQLDPQIAAIRDEIRSLKGSLPVDKDVDTIDGAQP